MGCYYPFVFCSVVKVQSKNNDLISGISQVQKCIEDLKKVMENVNNYSMLIFQHSCRVAEKSNVSVSMPRISQKQQHRLNPQCDSPEEYYKITVTGPFLDQLISDLESRFNKHAKQAASL